jgi:hypothetical protein
MPDADGEFGSWFGWPCTWVLASPGFTGTGEVADAVWAWTPATASRPASKMEIRALFISVPLLQIS